MVITQLKLTLNSKTFKVSEDRRISLIYLIFCTEQALKVPEDKKFCLVYLIACIANKQAIKLLRAKKLYMAYFIVYKSCYKIKK